MKNLSLFLKGLVSVLGELLLPLFAFSYCFCQEAGMSNSKPENYRQLEMLPETSADPQPNQAKWSVRNQRKLESKLLFKTLDEPPAWFQGFQALLEGGWPWRIATYIAWSSTPKKLRWPKTQKELAEKILGLRTQRQISYWRCHIPAVKAAILAISVAPMLEYRADVIHALIQSAIIPQPENSKDRKLFLEITGDYTPARRPPAESSKSFRSGISQLTDAELENLLPALQAESLENDDAIE